MPYRASQPASCHLTLVASVLILAGCSTYQLGNANLYRPDIRTVHVPVFESESLRRNLGERLTEAVVKELERRSPYKVVGPGEADSVLSGRITRESKRVTGLTRNSDVRSYDSDFVVQVRWVNRRGEVLLQQANLPVPQAILETTANANFIPEAGQSLATAQQRALERLAQDIVSQLETWW